MTFNATQLNQLSNQFQQLSNLPYYITSPIIEKFLAMDARFATAVFLVQLEVAERLVAKPGTRDYGYLTVATQLVCAVELVCKVPPEAFDPPPKVTSAVLAIRTKKTIPDVAISDRIFWLARLGFASRRKQLHSLLASPIKKTNAEVKELLVGLGLPATARAQELSIAQWTALAHLISI